MDKLDDRINHVKTSQLSIAKNCDEEFSLTRKFIEKKFQGIFELHVCLSVFVIFLLLRTCLLFIW